jgi:autotransporter-associated beta strand protein
LDTFNPTVFILNNSNANANLTFANGLDLVGGTRTVQVNAATATISGLVTNGALTKTGAGTLQLTGTNSYYGATTISAGTLSIAYLADIGQACNLGLSNITLSGGVLQYTGGNIVTNNRTITLTALSGLDIPAASFVTTNAVSGASTPTLIKTGNGTLTLAGATDNSSLGIIASNGVVVLAKSSSSSIHAVAGIRGIAAGATVQLGGSGGDQIYDGAGWGISNLFGTFDMNGRSETIGDLWGSGVITNTASATGTLTIGANSSYGFFSGVISDGAGTNVIIKTSNGAIIFTGSNTYKGPTIINSGTLQIGNGGTPGSGVISNNATFIIKRSDIYTIPNAWTGNGTNILAGNGTFTPNANNIISTTSLLALGDTNTAGNLDLSNFSQTVAGFSVLSTNVASTNVVTIGNNQTLTVRGNVRIGADMTNNYANLVVSGAGTLFVTNATVFQVSAGNNLVINCGVRAFVDMSNLANAIINVGNSGSLAVGDNQTAAAGGTDLSTFILASNTTITAGTLTLGPGQRGFFTQTLRLGSGSNVFNIATVNVGSSACRESGQILFNASTGTLTLRSTNGTGRAVLAIGVNTVDSGYSAYNAVILTNHVADLLLSTLSVGEQLRNGTSTNIFMFDTGTLDTTGLRIGNRHPATTVVSLPFVSTATLGGGAVTIGINGIVMGINYGTTSTGSTNFPTLNITGGNVTINGLVSMLTQNSNSNVVQSVINITGGAVTINSNIVKTVGTGTAANTATLTLNGGTLDMTGHYIGDATLAINTLNFQSGTLLNLAEINGSSNALIKTTTGTLYLGGVNTYTAGTIVSNGAVIIASTAALPGYNTNGKFTVITNTTLAVANAVADADVLTMLGTGNYLRGANLGFDTTAGDRFTSLSITDTVNGALGLVKLGNNTLTLTGTNTYSGNTTINAGILNIATTLALPGYNTAGRFTVASNATLAVANTVADPDVNLILGTGNFQPTARIGFDTADGDRAYALAITNNNIGLLKLSNNTLTLTATNTYGGATTISAGTLALGAFAALPNTPQITVASGAVFDVSVLNSGAFSLNNGQTLRGGGTVLGNVIADGTVGAVTINPQNTLTISGSLTLTNNPFIRININNDGLTCDTIVISSALSFVNMNTNWFIFTATNGLASGRHSYTLLNAIGGYGSSSFDTGGGTNYTTFLGYNELSAYLWLDSASQSLKLTVVPEPDALLLVAGGIGLLVLMRRRRRA